MTVIEPIFQSLNPSIYVNINLVFGQHVLSSVDLIDYRLGDALLSEEASDQFVNVGMMFIDKFVESTVPA